MKDGPVLTFSSPAGMAEWAGGKAVESAWGGLRVKCSGTQEGGRDSDPRVDSVAQAESGQL